MVTGHHREGEDIDGEVGGEATDDGFDPALSMVVVVAGNGIHAEESAGAGASAEGVNDLDFAGIDLITAVGA